MRHLGVLLRSGRRSSQSRRDVRASEEVVVAEEAPGDVGRLLTVDRSTAPFISRRASSVSLTVTALSVGARRGP
jgi:hypothetical protein